MEAVAVAAVAAAAAAAAVAAAAVDGQASSHSCPGSLPFPAPFQADRSSPKCFRPRQSQAAFDRWPAAVTAFAAAAAAGPFEEVLPSSGHASEEAAAAEVDRPVQEHPAAGPESVYRGTCNDTVKINTNCHNN